MLSPQISAISEKLVSCIEKDSFPQTILFHSPALSNIDTLLFSFAKKLVKPKRRIDDEKFSSLCSAGQFTDFINVVKGPTGSIKIEDVHAVEDALQYAPFESENRIVYFRDAAAMTDQAQNALLKKIEEPPQRTFFFLAVNKRNSILPTVLSRSVPIFVPNANLEAGFSEVFDYFPFLADLASEFGDEIFSAEKNKLSYFCSDLDFNSITSINKIYAEITDSSVLSKDFLGNIPVEKAEYLKKMLIRMRLAIIAFCVREKKPDISRKITVFLSNQQYFSPDASIFFTI
ncbi:hypothetical protein J5690_06865 [bacterium]|nr:hypothetical protein [bacterium]